jgi:hypothetical protein
VPCCAIAEFVKDAVSVCLLHFRVNVVARIAQLCNLLRKQLDPVNRVAENDALIDFKLGEEGVQAMDLLSLFDVRIELGDTA